MISSNKQLYHIMLKQKQCAGSRMICDKNCTDCPCYVEGKKLIEAFDAVINQIKAKDPELYFLNDIEELRSTLSTVVSRE